MQCPSGHENPEGAAFCNTCGSALLASGGDVQSTDDSLRRRPAWPILVGCAAALALLGGLVVYLVTSHRSPAGGTDAAGSTAEGGPAPTTFDVSGTLILHGTGDEDHGWNRQGSPCEGQGGYSDIVQGAQVVISNSKGEPVALGALGTGSTVEDDAWYQCHFDFDVPGVPIDGTIYSVEVTHRGEVSFSRAEADSLVLELGN